MKIGILTYHRTLNYGGCLQAFATRVVLESLGHEVYYIDYWPEYHKAYYDILSLSKIKYAHGLKTKTKLLIDAFKYGRMSSIRRASFEVFLKEQIYPYCKPLTESFDIAVYGSDQIWRKQNALNDYNPMYFGTNIIKAKKHIAYSASMGNLPANERDKKVVATLLRNFDKISVREQQLSDFIEECGIERPIVTLDPTLAVDKDIWNNIVTKAADYKKYILVYALHNEFNINSIREYAKTKGLEVKVIYGDVKKKGADRLIETVGPYEFLSLIYNANLVFTSSFHGLCFSLIFEKEFFTSFSTNSDRAKSLLEILGIQDRFLQPHCDCPISFNVIEYKKVNVLLEQKRTESKLYLSYNCKI